eukprot:5176371-Pleurochrysis_carterae.AAC.1
MNYHDPLGVFATTPAPDESEDAGTTKSPVPNEPEPYPLPEPVPGAHVCGADPVSGEEGGAQSGEHATGGDAGVG